MLVDIRDYDFTAGETKLISIPGRFFQVMSAAADFTAYVLRFNSSLGAMQDVPAGIALGPLPDTDEPFHGVKIYSATAQTLKICIADRRVDLRVMNGIVSISGGQVQPVGGVDNAGTPPTVIKQQVSRNLTGYTFSSGGTTATLVAAAANVNGIEVLFAVALTDATSGGGSNITANGNMVVYSQTGTDDRMENFTIPAGQDLSVSCTTGGRYAIAYKLL